MLAVTVRYRQWMDELEMLDAQSKPSVRRLLSLVTLLQTLRRHVTPGIHKVIRLSGLVGATIIHMSILGLCVGSPGSWDLDTSHAARFIPEQQPGLESLHSNVIISCAGSRSWWSGFARVPVVSVNQNSHNLFSFWVVIESQSNI
jgi:hypothetical protein